MQKPGGFFLKRNEDTNHGKRKTLQLKSLHLKHKPNLTKPDSAK